MTSTVDDLVSLFAAKLRMDGMRVSAVERASRELPIVYRGDPITLVLPGSVLPRLHAEGDEQPGSVLPRLLAEGDELARDPWGPSVSAQEAAPRIMTVHLEEYRHSSDDDDLSGIWT